MIPAMFAIIPASLPQPFDRARAQRTFEQLADAGYVPGSEVRVLLEAAFGNSPYLCRLAVREHAVLSRLFAEGPGALLAEARDRALAAAAARPRASSA